MHRLEAPFEQAELHIQGIMTAVQFAAPFHIVHSSKLIIWGQLGFRLAFILFMH